MRNSLTVKKIQPQHTYSKSMKTNIATQHVETNPAHGSQVFRRARAHNLKHTMKGKTASIFRAKSSPPLQLHHRISRSNLPATDDDDDRSRKISWGGFGGGAANGRARQTRGGVPRGFSPENPPKKIKRLPKFPNIKSGKCVYMCKIQCDV